MKSWAVVVFWTLTLQPLPNKKSTLCCDPTVYRTKCLQMFATFVIGCLSITTFSIGRYYSLQCQIVTCASPNITSLVNYQSLRNVNKSKRIVSIVLIQLIYSTNNVNSLHWSFLNFFYIELFDMEMYWLSSKHWKVKAKKKMEGIEHTVCNVIYSIRRY